MRKRREGIGALHPRSAVVEEATELLADTIQVL
jgi:hypothetical protein